MFDNDDNEDFGGGFGDEYKSLEEMLRQFKEAQAGRPCLLSEEDFETLLSYFEVEGDKANMQRAFDLATTLHPLSIDMLLHKAEWLIDQNKLGQALRTLEDAEAIGNTGIEGLFLRVDVLVDMLRFDEAIALLESKVDQYSVQEQSDIYLELCDIYDTLEEFDDVYRCLKILLKNDPQNDEALMRMSFWADVTGNTEDAIDIYQKSIEDNPFSPVLWYNLGCAFHTLKLYEKATEAFLYCLDLDEQFEYAYRNLGDTYVQLKQYDNAIEILEKHLRISTPEDIVLETIGDCWSKKKDYSKARSYYRKASNMTPSDDSLFYKIGVTYVLQSEWEKAMKSYAVAYSLNKNNANYSVALGDCYLQLQSNKDAIVCYLNAVRLKPSNRNVWMALLRGLYMSELYDEMLNQCVIAQEYCDNKPEFLYYQLAGKLALGKIKEATLALEHALQVAPRKLSVLKVLDPEILHHPSIAEVLLRNKRKK
ncbi:MAG: hypothetical protein RL660_2035 [Bacteroidota bacterium]|jgi:tetratricopeptide (TPR) repeat protein